jgi:hypothetical protein
MNSSRLLIVAQFVAFLGCGVIFAQTYPPAMNLSRYMPVTASSGSGTAKYAVDGMVCEESRWKSANVTTPHWLQVALPGTFEIGSANVITGDWDVGVTSFKLQYWSGAAWLDIPGAVITGNTSSQRQIVFTNPVTTDRVRFYSDQDWEIEVKEFAVFPAQRRSRLPYWHGNRHPVRPNADDHCKQPEQFHPASLSGLRWLRVRFLPLDQRERYHTTLAGICIRERARSSLRSRFTPVWGVAQPSRTLHCNTGMPPPALG